MVAGEIRRSGYGGLLGAGVVLTGGVAEQAGLRELAENVLDLPVRVGEPQGIERLDERLSGPAYATAVGLLLWAEEHVTAGRPAVTNGFKLPNAAGVMGRWLKSFVP